MKLSKPNIGKGDYGSTEFIGTAVAYKSSWQAEACGTVDELNAMIGEAYTRIQQAKVKSDLLRIAKDLFILGTDIANTRMSKKDLPRITTRHIHHIEELIIKYEKSLKRIHHFIVPIGPPSFTILQQARAVCRRAERQLVKFMKSDKTDIKNNPLTLAYLNRLGDLFFEMARFILKESDFPEIYWSRDVS
ncbi:MAG: ATP:cob(I)alamin adenosyltransferase [Elusimicrobia bacterium RIFCSPLOWO2_02_FULL_39_32]|nr:MAG: ATP:cob(I)alamin adenosyltransferase [Elusimicrobia bacterium GWA2_38_7]OGR80083.1 MAG: ATP:cob(I)alamin adenosyltransferase [Elusimicrobia bacterium RIFCSPHIGHO2_02_FULL_39_36]OGR91122.1 MAG: ATP:cob(I)alamin adenosyltransferase [Elusimicrobia bacterium RIFCSPLOWO2_02_FULL_39_32]OGS00089.1 MAG: ATP:cob(I)alamin adenosyltransferase [Elusimicrobia bacterium RIFCSPLOWO2_12_FULL_39_28]